MKKLFLLLSIVLIASLPILSTAQFSVGILTAPISTVTSTKKLVPIGAELKLSPTTSIVLEYGIPVFSKNTYGFNEKAASYNIEFRSYRPVVAQRKFQKYFSIRARYIPESYAVKNNSYLTKDNQEILFDYAEVNTSINSMSIRLGLQRVFKNKFILDFNIGVRINKKIVDYRNISLTSPSPLVPTPYSGWDIGLDVGSQFESKLSPYSFSPNFFPQPDHIEKSHIYVNFPISVRVGYLFSRK